MGTEHPKKLTGLASLQVRLGQFEQRLQVTENVQCAQFLQLIVLIVRIVLLEIALNCN